MRQESTPNQRSGGRKDKMFRTIAGFGRIGEENAFAVLARATELAGEGKDIINLGIGQPDFRTPEHIVEAESHHPGIAETHGALGRGRGGLDADPEPERGVVGRGGLLDKRTAGGDQGPTQARAATAEAATMGTTFFSRPARCTVRRKWPKVSME
jgi:hypothetical protein